jgi:hypothetical protein
LLNQLKKRKRNIQLPLNQLKKSKSQLLLNQLKKS